MRETEKEAIKCSGENLRKFRYSSELLSSRVAHDNTEFQIVVLTQ